MEPVPLAAVTLVFRSKPKLTGLAHVVSAVSVFLDTSVELPLDVACKFGSIVLLDRIWDYNETCNSIFTEETNPSWTFWNFFRTDIHYRQYQFTKVMMEAVRLQDVEIVRWLASTFPETTVVMSVVDRAASSGSLEILQVFYDQNTEDPGLDVQWEGNLLAAGARNSGSVEMLKWLDEHGQLDGLRGLVIKAAGSGFADAVPLKSKKRKRDGILVPSIPECSVKAMDGAAANGHLAVVQWLHCNQSEGCTVRAMNDAARNGHLEVVEWLFTNRSEGCTTFAMDTAAENGHLEVVKYLHNKNVMGSKNVMDSAAGSGNLELVKWLHCNITEGCTTTAMDTAAANGHLHVIKWLHNNRTEGCSENATNFAAQGGHIRVLQWLYSHWPTVCTSEALKSALHLLSQYLARYG
eukprot:jgi/Phyca11/119848/e_gw1.39.148.1